MAVKSCFGVCNDCMGVNIHCCPCYGDGKQELCRFRLGHRGSLFCLVPMPGDSDNAPGPLLQHIVESVADGVP